MIRKRVHGRRGVISLVVQVGGALTGLTLYLLVQTHMLSATSVPYVATVLAVSVLIGLTAWYRGEAGLVLIQLIWIAVGTVTLFKIVR